LIKTSLIEGGRTFQPNFNQIYKLSEGQFKYQIRKSCHWHVQNLKALMRYNPYAHMVDYVLLVDLIQVPNKEAFDKSKFFELQILCACGEPFHRSSKEIDGGIYQ